MIASLFYHLPRKVQLPMERMWYGIVSALDRDADMLFMNYGWADLGAAAKTLFLRPEDEPNRYCIQLYHRVAGAIDLTGLDVLEVGCGRGGGAWYISRYLNPRSITGLDRTVTSIAFCRAHYGRTDEELSGVALCAVMRINANVLKALEVDNARKQALIQTKVPRVLHPFFNEFAAMKGSRSIYSSLRSGKRVYLRFVAIRRC